jgi:hypothetical protein
MDGDVLHPQWGRSGRQDLLQLLRSVRGTKQDDIAVQHSFRY